MAITSVAGLLVAPRQEIVYVKTDNVTVVAGVWYSRFTAAGSPPAGVVALVDTDHINPDPPLPVSTILGYPPITAYGGTNKGYLTNLTVDATVPSVFSLVDLLYISDTHAGGTSAVFDVVAPPSYSARVPSGTDFSGLILAYLAVEASPTVIPAVTVTYTNQAGVTGRTTGVASLPSLPTINSVWALPLQQGDVGIQKVETISSNITGSTSFAILIMRPISYARVKVPMSTTRKGFASCKMEEIFPNSALLLLQKSDSTTTGVVDCTFTIAKG